MRVLTVKKLRTLVPTSIFRNVRALLKIVEIQMWRPSEILLPVSIVAFTPLVLFVNIRAKTCFVGVEHELL